MRRIGWNLSITAIAAIVCALAFPAASEADTITLAWDPSPYPTVVGYMMYVEGPSGYSKSFDVGMNVGFPFTEAVAGQQYCFTLASYAAGPLVGPRSSPVCGYSNMSPTFSAVSDRSTVVGQAVSLQLDAHDPDGQPLTYTATGLPPGLTLQSSTGFISGTPTTVGTYNVTLTARDESLSSVQTFRWSIVAPGGTAPSTSATTAGALTLTSLTADRPAPQPAGSSITFTATVAGGVGPHQYKWWVQTGYGWFVARNWAQGNTWTWRPTVANSGYRIAVWVRNATTTADTYENNQSSGTIEFPIGGTSQAPLPATSTPSGSPLTLTSLAADRPAPQPAGSSITFTATASGGASPYQYKWWIYDGANWIITQQWATSNRWTWTPSAGNSAYRVGVWVRNAGSSTDIYDNAGSNGSIAYPISAASTSSSTSTPPPSTTTSGGVLTLTGIGADRVAPQPVGTSVTFTALATGGAAPYQYKWWTYDGANWVVRSGWSTSNTWTWTPTVANVSYRVAVWVRNAGSSGDVYDNAASNGSIAFPITSGGTSTSSSPLLPSSSTGGTLILNGISTSRPAPSPAGVAVTFTASISGGVGPQQFKWFVYDGATWWAQTGWSTSNTWTWAPPEAFSYRVAVWVRNAGSTADAYDNAQSNGSISFVVY